MVQAESQQQAADQVSISNSIGSLRYLGAMDWREFVETMSVVEQILREDPGGVYGRMDFATRDRYRHVVERIAKTAALAEGDVARKAIELAQRRRGRARAATDRAAHVGYYLVGEGCAQLEQRRGGAPARRREAGASAAADRPCCCTWAGSSLITLILAGLLVAQGATAARSNGWMLGADRRSVAGGASQLAVALVNWLATLLVDAARAAADGFLRGHSAECRTLVVVPTMLPARQASRTWSRRWRSASWRTGTRTSTSPC